jgi:hypothetical protein
MLYTLFVPFHFTQMLEVALGLFGIKERTWEDEAIKGMKLIVSLSLFPSQEYGIHVMLLAILPAVEYVFKSFIVILNQYKHVCAFLFIEKIKRCLVLFYIKLIVTRATFNSEKN